MTVYYVSSEIGHDNNAGTSQSAPLASLQAAANVVKPGDTVQVMNGTYTAPAYGVALDITTSGTASAPITFEAAPGQTPVIDSSGGWNAIDIQASYIVVSGFTVVGGAADFNLQQALAGYSTGNAALDGNGIVVNPTSSVPSPNHITIENNTVSNEPGGGIALDQADYVQILNNVVHNNGNWSAYGTSGITINSSVNFDTKAGPHDIVSGNTVYDNAQLVPSNGVGAITDGEGIILDSNQGYTGEILVENNTIYGNGSSGIESFLTNNAVITGNTIYGNDTNNVQPQSDAEILINQSSNNTVTNNTTVNPSVPAPVISKAVANSNGTVTLTGTAVGGAGVTIWNGGANPVGTATASSAGAWNFTTPDLLPGPYTFTATDHTSAGGTSAPSSSLAATVSANSSVAPPVITSVTWNSSLAVTLRGTAAANSTVTVWSTSGDNDGSVTASSTGVWSFTTPPVYPGIYGWTATDTTSAGTSLSATAVGANVSAATASTTTLPAAPTVAKGVVNSNGSVTLTGTAPGGATVTVSDGGASALGSATAGSAGAWSFTTPGLPAGAYAFTAIDKTAAGTSAKSSPLNLTVPLPAAPSIAKGVVNSNDSVTLTGTAPSGAGVTVSDGGAAALGTATATSAGAWSFTTADLAVGAYAFTATDKTAAGTSAKSSSLSVTVPKTHPAAPKFTKGVVNSNGSVTLTGTAPNGAAVTVSNGGASPLGSTAASSVGAWSFTTAGLPARAYAFTATDTTTDGTSAASSPFNVTVPLPAAPSIAKGVVNSNDSVTLTGTALNGATVTVSDGGASALGTATAGSAGAWSFTTADLAGGAYAFTATDKTAAGTSAKSSALNVTVPGGGSTASTPVMTRVAVSSTQTLTVFSAGGHLYGTELHNLTAASDELNLAVSGVTVTRGKGTESLQAGSTVFPFSSSDYASTETIDAKSGDHFVLQPGFGHETIQGFQGSGSNPDTLQLSISSFPYMNTGMSQSADLAALLMHSTGGTSTTIADSSGDTLTLAGLSGTTIAADAAASPSLFKFV